MLAVSKLETIFIDKKCKTGWALVKILHQCSTFFFDPPKNLYIKDKYFVHLLYENDKRNPTRFRD